MTPVFSGRAKLVISLAKYGFAPRGAVFDVLSLSLNKESTKESQLKGLMPLRNPQVFSLWHICRSCWLGGERGIEGVYVFPLFLHAERHGTVSKGSSLWRATFAPALARCSRPRTSKLAISACRNLFSWFVLCRVAKNEHEMLNSERVRSTV